MWERYEAEHDAGVIAYEIGTDFIRVRFKDASEYLYTDEKPGRNHVEQMKTLAETGRGLTTYINQHVRDNYFRKEN